MTIRTKSGKAYRMKKSTIDLRYDGRLDWFMKSIGEHNAERERIKKLADLDALELGELFCLPPKLSKEEKKEMFTKIKIINLVKSVLP